MASDLKLSLFRTRMVHGNRAAPVKIFWQNWPRGRKGATEVLVPLVIYGDDGEYTDEAMGILGEG